MLREAAGRGLPFRAATGPRVLIIIENVIFFYYNYLIYISTSRNRQAARLFPSARARAAAAQEGSMTTQIAPNSTATQAVAERVVLHVGCGPYSRAKLHRHFHEPGWREVRL